MSSCCPNPSATAGCCGDSAATTHQQVSEYYGKILTKTADLKTTACTSADAPPDYIKKALRLIHPEVLDKYYGCGLVVPHCVEGLRVLDLGCGAGRDVYVLSALVGPTGSVVGVDMTEEQLAVARKYVDWHTEKNGYTKPNVEFKQGYIEKLDFPDASFDLIVSNCVVNLSPDKRAVLSEAYRVLKPGGELYFSDVYSNRRVPTPLVADPVLFGECISGALYWNDFVRLAQACGFKDPRLVKDNRIRLKNAAIEALVGHIDFYSATYRLWKLPSLEPDCEDYGQAVVYKGTVPESPESFTLDSHHTMEKGKVFLVCGNTFSMLKETRFAPHFDFIGDRSCHYGIYADCGRNVPFASAGKGLGGAPSASSCC